MHTPLQIAFHDVEGTEELRGLIEQKLAWLMQGHARVVGCRVAIGGPPPGGRLSNPYRVRLELAVPGGTLAVERRQPRRREGRDLGTLVREAFEVARRRLEAHARRQRRGLARPAGTREEASPLHDAVGDAEE